MSVSIIGIDCATKPKNIGLARGKWEPNRLIIQEVELGNATASSIREVADKVAKWAHESEKALLALDAPLGWPEGIREGLKYHHAGQRISVKKDMMFKRKTDRFVKEKTGQNPLEVGADKLARTAHVTLKLLDCIRDRITNIGDILLSWDQATYEGVQAIEVYPAVGLWALGLPTKNYKGNKNDNPENRKKLVNDLVEHKELKDHVDFCQGISDRMQQNDNLLDAVVCILTGVDFLCGKCVPPPEEDKELAHLEGWIWFRMKKPCQNSKQTGG